MLANSCSLSPEPMTIDSLYLALQMVSESLSSQGGKISLILANNNESFCRSSDLCNTMKSDYFCSDTRFSNISQDLRKYMIGTDLYVFGGLRYTNLASLTELIRLSGGCLHFYDEITNESSTLTSPQLLQRVHV